MTPRSTSRSSATANPRDSARKKPAPVRLQKYLAAGGLCSRREADRRIAAGEVMVNGKPAVPGQSITPGVDLIVIPGESVPEPQGKTVTLAMNKPRGVICSNSDPHHHDTVFDLLPPRYRELRMFCAGRLDKDSEGLLILTNDGALTHRLTHPSAGIIKRYRVELQKPFNTKLIPRLLEGVEFEGEQLRATRVIPASRGPEAGRRLEVHLQQGRKREIRRMFEVCGYFVKRLKRIQIGGYVLRGIPPGATKELNQNELALLSKNV